MFGPAFITAVPCGALSSSFTPAAPARLHARPTASVTRRLRLRPARMSMADDQMPVKDAKPPSSSSSSSEPDESESASPSPSISQAPSLDTTVFSDFVDSAQARIDNLVEQVQDVDVDELVGGATDAGKGLVDNLLAGDWLNRGELYGAIQLTFVYVLIKAPGSLDGIVSLLTGPLLLLAGGFLSGKALLDLGRKQLSIWPAPVPNAELKTDGMYQFVRHPVYAGLLTASAGYASMTGSPARLAITVAFAFFLIKKMAIEEQFLAEAYPEYEQYCEDVPYKVIPKIF